MSCLAGVKCKGPPVGRKRIIPTNGRTDTFGFARIT